jgi:hypothetical protein
MENDLVSAKKTAMIKAFKEKNTDEQPSLQSIADADDRG